MVALEHFPVSRLDLTSLSPRTPKMNEIINSYHKILCIYAYTRFIGLAGGLYRTSHAHTCDFDGDGELFPLLHPYISGYIIHDRCLWLFICSLVFHMSVCVRYIPHHHLAWYARLAVLVRSYTLVVTCVCKALFLFALLICTYIYCIILE